MKRFKSFVLFLVVLTMLVSMTSAFATSSTYVTREEYEDALAIAQRALDIAEVESVAGKHEYYHSALMHKEELENIWATEHEITWKNNTQYMIGTDNVYAFYVTDLESAKLNWLQGLAAAFPDENIEITEENYGMGMLWYHMLTTPVIEVAGDGQTAKGLWMSVGTVTQCAGGGMSTQLTCENYGIDFVKENGEWKIWHLRTYVYFYTEMGEYWWDPNSNIAAGEATSEDAPAGVNSALADAEAGAEGAPSGGGQSSDYAEIGQYFVGYSYLKVPDEPEIPEPYYTFSETFSY